MECLHVGEPRSDFSCYEIKIVYFHNFLDLSDAKGDDNVVLSPEFSCFGHRWQLRIYPGGDNSADEEYMSVYLENLESSTVVLNYAISVLRSGRREKLVDCDMEVAFHPKRWIGDHNGIDRYDLLKNSYKYLQNGSLAIMLQLRLAPKLYRQSIYRYKFPYDVKDIFNDKETSDITFDVGGKLFHAHKCIIKANAKDFYVMCEEYSTDSPMLINDVHNSTFSIMINSLYGRDPLPYEWRKYSKLILKAASKYGIDKLKSDAERWYANSLEFTVDNVIGEFMKADGNNHTIVRAAAKSFIIEHGEEVVASESFAQLHESLPLMREVMAATIKASRKRKRDYE